MLAGVGPSDGHINNSGKMGGPHSQSIGGPQEYIFVAWTLGVGELEKYYVQI